MEVITEKGQVHRETVTFQKILLDREGNELHRDAQILLKGVSVAFDNRIAPLETRRLVFNFRITDSVPVKVKAEIIWTTSAPLVADTLGEEQDGDILAGRPRYPHRGVVRRRADLYRSAMTTADPRVITSRRPGYFHLNADGDNAKVFLTRVSPDNNPKED